MARRFLVVAAVLLLVGGVAWSLESNGRVDPRIRGLQSDGGRRTTPEESPSRGVVYEGLRPADRGPCRGAFVVEGSDDMCTHGPDPAPPDVNIAVSQPTAAPTPTSGRLSVADGDLVLCDGDGSSAERIEAIYARPSDRPDRYYQYVGSFRIWAAHVDHIFDRSALESGGHRRLRWVTDPECHAVIHNVVLPASGHVDFSTMVYQLRQMGFVRTGRHLLVWMDDTLYCGLGSGSPDNIKSPWNGNNRSSAVARVDTGCWGRQRSTEAHEIMHGLGGVSSSSPHATAGHHCTDEWDLMCYKDGDGVTMQFPCGDKGHENLFDCGHDDYYSTAPAPGSYLERFWNPADSTYLLKGVPAPRPPPHPAPAPATDRYSPLPPARVLDTRTEIGGHPGPVSGGGTALDLTLAGVGGVPVDGVDAVAFNLTVVNPSAPGYVTAYPTGPELPNASTINFSAGQTIANLTIVKLGPGGRVSLYLNAGTADLLVDVAGWFGSRPGGEGDRYRASTIPRRLLDTRTFQGGHHGRATEGETIVVAIGTGAPQNASAVVLNVAATTTTASSYVTVFPSGGLRPEVSNLNFVAGQTEANRAIVKVGENASVSVFLGGGTANLVVDVTGWFAADASSPPGELAVQTPYRLLDTRIGLGQTSMALASGRSMAIDVAGKAGVPSGARAVLLNATVTNTAGGGYLVLYADGMNRPESSDLNFADGQTVANLAAVPIGTNGRIVVYQAGAVQTDVVLDVVGWMS